MMQEFQKQCLESHNELRKKHGTPPLKLSKELCKSSQDWAEHLLKANKLEHSNNEKYGENIYAFTSTDPNAKIHGKDPAEYWYSEIKDHKFGVEPKSLASGHFTQVIWRDTEEMGVAYASKGGKFIVVANYSPRGNHLGHFAEQVPPVGSAPSKRGDKQDDKKKAAGSSEESKKGTQGNFEQDFLNSHNNYRKKHGVPALKLDKELCKQAQEWADHLASKNVLENRPNNSYGENIYCVTSSDPNHTIGGNVPVDAWYDGVNKHTFGKEPKDLKSGQFTQLVWKKSEAVGVGVAKNKDGRIFVVANYSPPGNYVGQFTDNVPPAK